MKFKLWSVVMITDCAASGSSPSRPAARATISNAALFTVSGIPELGAVVAHHSVPTIKIPGSANLRNSTQLSMLKTALG